MRNNDSLSYLVNNKFVIYFFTIKRMRKKQKEKTIFMNGKIY